MTTTNNVNTVKAGIMPGRLEEYAVPVTTTFNELFATAGIASEGFEVKVDGAVVTNFDNAIGSANTILLAKKVKGNAHEFKMGIMPGRLDTFAFESGTTFAKAFEVAGINPSGYEVKADGNTITNFDAVIGNPSTVLLTKKVKGNATEVKVGIMPGRLSDYALEDGTTYAKAFEIANIDPSGYEVKADGVTVSDYDSVINSAVNTVLLTKKVKGNSHEVKMGIMPGRLDTYAFGSDVTYAKAFEIASIDPTGYEVKADGNTITNFDAVVGQPSTILLTKKVKGNEVKACSLSGFEDALLKALEARLTKK